jgi:hypothetical protein
MKVVLNTFGWMICLASAAAQSQLVQGNHTGAAAAISSSSAPDPNREIVREIDDPATGNRWLLERSSLNDGGPGRMLLFEPGKASSLQQGTTVPRPDRRDGPGGVGKQESARRVVAPILLIRAGERLIVEEHTELLDATLEAVALSGASQGESLRVRLLIGWRVVNAVAVAPGRALLATDVGVAR